MSCPGTSRSSPPSDWTTPPGWGPQLRRSPPTRPASSRTAPFSSPPARCRMPRPSSPRLRLPTASCGAASSIRRRTPMIRARAFWRSSTAPWRWADRWRRCAPPPPSTRTSSSRCTAITRSATPCSRWRPRRRSSVDALCRPRSSRTDSPRSLAPAVSKCCAPARPWWSTPGTTRTVWRRLCRPWRRPSASGIWSPSSASWLTRTSRGCWRSSSRSAMPWCACPSTPRAPWRSRSWRPWRGRSSGPIVPRRLTPLRAVSKLPSHSRRGSTPR